MAQLDGSINSAAVAASGSVLVGHQVLRAGNQTVVSNSPVLPSYSQAISQTTTVVRAIRPAGQPNIATVNPAPIAVASARRSVDGVTLNGSTTGQRFSLSVPALSALLAGSFNNNMTINY